MIRIATPANFSAVAIGKLVKVAAFRVYVDLSGAGRGSVTVVMVSVLKKESLLASLGHET